MMDPIDRLAQHVGIGTSYRDQQGRTCVVSNATKRALLAACGIRIRNETEARAALEAFERKAVDRLLDPVVILRQDHRPHAVQITVAEAPSDARLEWQVSGQGGIVAGGVVTLHDLPLVAEVATQPGVFQRRLLRLPDDLMLGDYELHVKYDADMHGHSARAAVIVVPERAFCPPALEQGARLWGLSLQLYSVRSARNWGIGDFTDLREILRWAGDIGAAAIGINPLHALFLDDPRHVSPYSPSSRYFINPLYLDVTAIEGFAESEEVESLVGAESFQQELARVRGAPLVDYPGVTALKRPVLECLYRWFRQNETGQGARRLDFQRFREANGRSLELFAVFNALREWFGAKDVSLRDWRRWPPEFRDPASTAVATFAREHKEQVEFFAFLQWQADLQLTRCIEAADAARMGIGIYLDLAVGADAAGADTWSAPDLVANGATIGAPPDLWSPKGQNWGLPPLSVQALREQGFQPFAELLRDNMRDAGALRIDHVLGLMRMFWIPEGCEPSDGAYVAYPFDELMGVLALESHRNQCLVIGEDLGTLPNGFQAKMRSFGVLSYCLLYFERDGEGRYLSPSEYPADALVSITTHDLPTLWGYWRGQDIIERAAVGAYPDPGAVDAAWRERTKDRAGLIAALAREGLVAPDHPPDIVPFEAILHFIARTRCRVLMVGLEDLLGILEQPNLPGTLDEHPNWRRRLAVDIAAVKQDPRVETAARIFRSERATPPRT